MSVSESLEEIWRIKEKISAEIAEMNQEEVIRYFRERRPEWVGPLQRFKKPDIVQTPSRTSGV